MFNITINAGTTKPVTLATVASTDDATLLAKAHQMTSEHYHGDITIERTQGHLAIVFHADGEFPEQVLHVTSARYGR